MVTGQTQLGRLERVDLRQVWESEPQGFTPWLARAENLALLGNTVGLELDLEAQEKDVGPFRADLLCKDTANGHWVLIENQLEATDHTHLGQLLTYAAGLKAVTIIWIAQRFTEEHRAALDWLNEITDDRFTFFGLEVELWRIGDSPVAPKFNIVSKPNDWSKTVAEGAQRIEQESLTEGETLQLAFWTAFREFVLSQPSRRIKPTKPQPQTWMDIAIGTSDCCLNAIASLYDPNTRTYESGEVRAELVLEGERSKKFYAALEDQKSDIEAAMGEPLTWINAANRSTCRIYLSKPADIRDRSQWPEYHKWLLGQLDRMHTIFGPRIRAIASGVTPGKTNGSTVE